MSLCVKHDTVHDVDFNSLAASSFVADRRDPLVSMFVYHFRIWSIVTSEGTLLSSSTMLSEFMMLNIGLGGDWDGTIQSIVFVRELFGAPGNRDLQHNQLADQMVEAYDKCMLTVRNSSV